MSERNEFAAIVVLDGGVCRYGSVESDTALTLLAVASEDPRCWNEMNEFWPRYCCIAPAKSACSRVSSVPYQSLFDFFEAFRVFNRRETTAQLLRDLDTASSVLGCAWPAALCRSAKSMHSL